MKISIKFAALAGMLCVAGAALPASAQTNSISQTLRGNTFVGYSSGTKECPSANWTRVRQYEPNAVSGTLSGVVFYDNGSGVSRMIGLSKPDGTFILDLTSINGNGPVGTVTGTRKADGSMTSDFVSANGDCKYSLTVVQADTTVRGGGG